MTNKEAKKMFEIIRNTPSVQVFNKLPDDIQDSDNVLGIDWKDLLDTAIAALNKCEEPEEEDDCVPTCCTQCHHASDCSLLNLRITREEAENANN